MKYLSINLRNIYLFIVRCKLYLRTIYALNLLTKPETSIFGNFKKIDPSILNQWNHDIHNEVVKLLLYN